MCLSVAPRKFDTLSGEKKKRRGINTRALSNVRRRVRGRGRWIRGSAIWPCIVMNRELNFDRWLSDCLVGPCD